MQQHRLLQLITFMEIRLIAKVEGTDDNERNFVLGILSRGHRFFSRYLTSEISSCIISFLVH